MLSIHGAPDDQKELNSFSSWRDWPFVADFVDQNINHARGAPAASLSAAATVRDRLPDCVGIEVHRSPLKRRLFRDSGV
jgi:hypothetical protein